MPACSGTMRAFLRIRLTITGSMICLTKYPAALLFGIALAGCGVVPNDVIHLRDGNLRASTYNGASTYCEQKQLNARMLGKAPGDTGVDFRCE
ncbi:hypothetical protein [Variovorax sp. dw_954]|uniref:hypothetical protein n=1 Tax=Variovorax sp. dw_954 TaxID=2720078 RepID=UPI0021168BEE|nr:hypothetical protein [Variovorax sp. dw_954]